jgi:NADH:ubiquinone reductase (H+-translocating)
MSEQTKKSGDIMIPQTSKKRVVIVGGGFGGLKIAKGLRKKNFQVVLFDRHNYHTFQPLLYQVATAGLEPDSIAGPLRKRLKNFKDFYFRMATVESVDTSRNCIITEIGELTYDYLVIANGSLTNYFGDSELERNVFPLKQIPHALNLRSQLLQSFEKAVLQSDTEEKQSLMNFVIVGGGPTGVELAGALGELKLHVLPKDYPEINFKKMMIYLVEGLPRLLNGMSHEAGENAFNYLKRFDVQVLVDKRLKSYDGKTVVLDDGMSIPASTLIWAAGVKGNILPGVADASVFKSRIKVDEYCKVIGTDNVYAIGDVAYFPTEAYPNGLPMLAPVAIQQGSLLAKNLVNLDKGKEMKKFEYLDKGSMATIGRNKAVVDLPGNIRMKGFIAWWVWMFIHLLSIIGFRNKWIVLSNWIWNYFTFDRSTRLIIRPYVKKPARQEKEPEKEEVTSR